MTEAAVVVADILVEVMALLKQLTVLSVAVPEAAESGRSKMPCPATLSLRSAVTLPGVAVVVVTGP